MLFVRMILVSLVLGSMARADVFSIADLDLLNFTITPASGTSTILPGVNIATFAQALDSAGGFDQGSASGVDVFTATAAFATFLSLIPPPDETHKQLFLVKILGSTAALVGLGLLLYFLARRRFRTEMSPPST